MSALTGKRIRATRLLPWAFKEAAEPMTKEETRRELRELKKSVGMKDET